MLKACEEVLWHFSQDHCHPTKGVDGYDVTCQVITSIFVFKKSDKKKRALDLQLETTKLI